MKSRAMISNTTYSKLHSCLPSPTLYEQSSQRLMTNHSYPARTNKILRWGEGQRERERGLVTQEVAPRRSVMPETTANNVSAAGGDVESSSLPGPSSKQEHKKIVRLLTVVAYMVSVSMAALLLSAYYIFLWNPKVNRPTPLRLADPCPECYLPGRLLSSCTDLRVLVSTLINTYTAIFKFPLVSPCMSSLREKLPLATPHDSWLCGCPRPGMEILKLSKFQHSWLQIQLKLFFFELLYNYKLFLFDSPTCRFAHAMLQHCVLLRG